MTDAGITLRLASVGDTEPCYQLFMESVVDLTARQGAPWDPDVTDVWLRMEPTYRFITVAPPFVL